MKGSRIHYSHTKQDNLDDLTQQDSPMFAFTDLMIGVIFLLLIVISTLSLTYRSQIATEVEKAHERDKLTAELESTKNQLDLISVILEQEKQRFKEEKQRLEETLRKVVNTRLVPQSLLNELTQHFQQSSIPVSIDHDNGVIHFSESVLFATSSSTLTEHGIKILSRVAKILMKVLPCYSQKINYTDIEASNNKTQKKHLCSSVDNRNKKQIEAVFIEGHTDNVPFETKGYDNWLLSMSRAKTTYQQLLYTAPELNLLVNKSLQQLFSLSAYAQTRPIASNDTREGRAKNRRIDIRLISFGYTLDTLNDNNK